ncbi:putative ATP-dependent protease (CrgA) [Aspergillus flavus AF70]|nr:putative ATP-dependent protease (CrgA) [Aspergillus flavus AF70]
MGFTCHWGTDNGCAGEHCLGDCGADVLLSRLVDVFDAVLCNSSAGSEAPLGNECGFRVTWTGLRGDQPGTVAKSADAAGGLLEGMYDLVKCGRFDYDASDLKFEMHEPIDQENQRFERLKDAVQNELDCQVCYSLILDPLTTSCGHTFCRRCVAMALDHSDLCPACRRKLNMASTVKSEPTNKRISDIIETLYPEQVALRRDTSAQEVTALDDEAILPLFVSSLSLPTMPTFLHVFEARYRLMMQRVMQSRGRRFGMVMFNRAGRFQQGLGRSQFMQYGTALVVDRYELLPDGRSLVVATGLYRFKVLSSYMLDMYYVGKIQRVDDISVIEEENREALETSVADASGEQPLESMSTQQLFQLGLDFVRKQHRQAAPWLHPRVLLAYGDIPTEPSHFPWWFASVLPVWEEEKYTLLSTTSVRERLKITARWVRKLESRECDPLFILGATNPKQHSSQENKSSANSDSVTISNSEYQGLLAVSTQFAKLTKSLLNGGLSQETLDILIYGSPPLSDNQNSSKVCTESSLKCKKTPSPTRANLSNDHKRWESYDDDDDEEEEEEEGVLLASQDSDRDDYEDSSRSSESSIASTPQRTILLRGLPDRATHRDLVEAIKGGALLHVHLRTRERMASISFVEEANAQEFYQHAKSHGVCIAGKRVEISWNDRQFYLPPFVRAKINTGASRNLVLYNVHPNVTEWLIRKDLDHIHNLIVITVKFKNGNAYISTNSVHNALFARSCMMSRLTYKGMRIAFYPDECAEPLSKLTNGLKKESQVPSKKSVSALNRFQLLSLDGAEEDETDHDHGQVGLDSYRQNTALKVQY